MEVWWIVRPLMRPAVRCVELALQRWLEKSGDAGRHRDGGDEIGLLTESLRRRLVVTRLAAVAGTRHLPAGAMSRLAAGHLLRLSPARRANRHVSGKQRRHEQNDCGHTNTSHSGHSDVA